MKIVIIYWPGDEDRGQEVFGKPGWSDGERDEWVREVQAAGDAGDSLLSGAHFILTEASPPFEVGR